MGSRMRQFPLFLAALIGATVLVSSALGSSFPGTNGKLVYSVVSAKGAGYLASANADGTGTKQITTPSVKPGDMQPRVSADGAKVVFIRNPSKFGFSKVQLWVGDTDGKGDHQVSLKGLPKDTYPLAPTFTPDGNNIVFELDNINAPIGIWEVAVGGGTATQLTNGNDYQPTVSPDGTQIAFMRGFDLTVANADGSDPQTLYTATGSSIGEPDFSPDGSTLAFMQYNPDASSWDIWAVPTDGSADATNLTNGSDYSSMDPAFSPDGTEMAFTSINNTTYATTIDEMPASGGTATAVITPPTGGVVYEPDWAVPAQSTPPPHHKKKHHHKKPPKHHKKK